MDAEERDLGCQEVGVRRQVAGQGGLRNCRSPAVEEGDAGGIAYTRNTWLDEVGWVVGNWFPTRTATVVGQFAAHWWRVSGIGVAEEGYAPSVRIGAGG